VKGRTRASGITDDPMVAGMWKVRRDARLQVACAEDQGRHVMRLARQLDSSLAHGQYERAVMLSSNIASLATILSSRLSEARNIAMTLAAITGERAQDILGEQD
jgi:hypothetical protein